MKKAIFLFAIVFALFAAPVLAQEAGDTAQPVPVQTAEQQQPIMSAEMQVIVAEAIKEEEKPENVKKDEIVRSEDLGIMKESKILPDNFLYIFKEIGRAIQSAITFDPVKKAELQLEQANTKMMEARQLFDKEGDKEADKVAKTIEGAQKKIENIAENTEKLKTERKEGAPEVDKFLDKLADQQIKQQKVMQKLEEQVPEEAFVRIKEAREKSLENFGQVMAGVSENNEEMGQRIEKAINLQEGGDFKEFKNLEILKAMKEQMPDEARGEIQNVEEAQMKDLVRKAEQNREEFTNYVENIGGAFDKHIEILDEARMMVEVPLTFISQLNILKEKAYNKFEDEIQQFETEEGRGAAISGTTGDTAGDLKIRSQLLERLPDNFRQEVKKADDEFAARIKEQFKNDPEAIKTVEAIKQLSDNPDAASFEAISRLEKEFTPEQKKYIRELTMETAQKVSQKIIVEGGSFEARFVDPTNPQSLRVLEDLKTTLPPEAMQGMNRAIEVQRQTIDEHMGAFDDPRMIENVYRAVEIDDELRKSFEAGDPQFFENMKNKKEELDKQAKDIMTVEQKKIEEKSREFMQDPSAFKGEGMPQFMMEDFERGMKEQQQGPGFFDKVKEKIMPAPQPAPPGAPQEEKPVFQEGNPQQQPEKPGFFDRILNNFKQQPEEQKVELQKPQAVSEPPVNFAPQETRQEPLFVPKPEEQESQPGTLFMPEALQETKQESFYAPAPAPMPSEQVQPEVKMETRPIEIQPIEQKPVPEASGGGGMTAPAPTASGGGGGGEIKSAE